MPKGEVTRIISVVPKPTKTGKMGYLHTIEVDQEIVTRWDINKKYVEVGDIVNYFFDEAWHKPKFERAVENNS